MAPRDWNSRRGARISGVQALQRLALEPEKPPRLLRIFAIVLLILLHMGLLVGLREAMRNPRAVAETTVQVRLDRLGFAGTCIAVAVARLVRSWRTPRLLLHVLLSASGARLRPRLRRHLPKRTRRRNYSTSTARFVCRATHCRRRHRSKSARN